jgi:zinc protease
MVRKEHRGMTTPVEASSAGPYPYQRVTLGNGMTVITLEDRTCPVAAVQLWYHVGSKNEQPDRRGFAHMFEHMMFRGTDRLGPEDHFNFIRRTGGDCNAYTSFDQTVYVQEVPADQIEMVLWLESERMAFLRIDEEGFKTERNVVAEEYRHGAEQPYGTVADKVLPEVFRGGCYSWTPIGVMEELEVTTPAELQRFWETYYVPNNATLVVVGDVRHAEVQALARKYFEWIPRYPDPPPLPVPPTEHNHEPLSVEVKETTGPAPVVAVGLRTVRDGHPDVVLLDMLAGILGGGDSSRLYRRLVIRERIAMTTLASTFHFEDDGLFGAAALLSPTDTVNPFHRARKKALGAIRQEIRRLLAEGITEQELRKARNNALRDLVTGQLTAASKASLLGLSHVIRHDLADVNVQFERIRGATVADLMRVAGEYLRPEREIELVVAPSVAGILARKILPHGAGVPVEETTAGASAPRDEPSGKPGLAEARPAELAPAPPVSPVAPQKVDYGHECFELDSGLRVVVIPRHRLPFVSVRLGVLDGASSDSAGTPGSAAMAAQLILRGTERRTYDELAEDLDTQAIAVHGNVALDSAAVDASAVTESAPEAARALAEVVCLPTFPEDQWQTLREQVRTSKAIEEKEPAHLAARQLRRRIYGAHPYSRHPDGDLADLDRITVESMREWWKARVRPERSVLYLAGDVSAARARELAAEHFGDWRGGPAPAAPELPSIPAPEANHIYLVDVAGDQSQIRVGQVSITRKHPRYFDVLVLNQVFGGGFNSRLNKSIRVEKGLTYGASGGVTARRQAGIFGVSTFSKNATVGVAIEAILEEIRRLKREAPSAGEMEMARSYLLGNFLLSRETPQALVSDLWLLEYEGLGADYFDRYLHDVAASTGERVLEVATELLDDQRLTIVVVGPAKKLLTQLEGIAPVTVVER